MQATTFVPAQTLNLRAGIPIKPNLERIAGSAIFLNALMRAAGKPIPQPQQANGGEPLRPAAFIPLSLSTAPTAANATSKSKRNRKKSANASGSSAPTPLPAHR